MANKMYELPQEMKCFAIHYDIRTGDRSCRILKTNRCTFPECPFYKTKETVALERMYADNRLSELFPEEWTGDYEEFYARRHQDDI